MTKYIAILEHADDGSWSAYVPDLPGCTSFGPTRTDVAKNIREAVTSHISALRQHGDAIPEPTSLAEEITVG